MNTKPEDTHTPLSSSTPPPPYPPSDPKTKPEDTHTPLSSSTPPPSYPPSDPKTKPEETHTPSSSSTPPPPPYPPSDPNTAASSSTTPPDPNSEKWGTHIMGPPAPPSSHPNNQKAALWSADEQLQPQQHPYIQYSPVDHKSSKNPIEPAVHLFNSWSHKAETLARNIWQNLKTGSSVPGAVYGKVGLTTKVITGGGFESLYRQTFVVTDPNEKLKRTFACYLSTATGPVAGTLYLSNIHVAFCSDRPLSFPAPSGQEAWSYYKVILPLANIGTISPVTLKENVAEKYIQISTVDNHDFWFMGFVNYDKAEGHLTQSHSEFITTAAQPVLGHPVGP